MAVQTMSLENLDRFGVEPESDKLYWDGKEIVVAARLPKWVTALAAFAGIGTIVTALCNAVTLIIVVSKLS